MRNRRGVSDLFRASNMFPKPVPHPLQIGTFLSNCLPHQIFQVMNEWRSTLIGRICFDDSICSNRDLYRAFKGLWNVHKTLHITECGRNRFVFKFRYQFDLQRILNGGPWSIYGFLVVLKPWNPFELPLEVVLAREAFWLRLLNLPTLHLNEESIWSIASNAGQLLFIDPNCPDGIRVRVLVDVDSQLKRGANTPIIGGVRSWIQFQYEKLPYQFCDICYHLGHLKTACPTLDYTLLEELQADVAIVDEPLTDMLDPLVLGNLNINEELINPYGDGNSDQSLPTLDILLNSSSEKSTTVESFIEMDFLKTDPCRFLLNRSIELNFTNPIPPDELQRYRNGKRTRTEDVGSSSNQVLLNTPCLVEVKIEPTSPRMLAPTLGIEGSCGSNWVSLGLNNMDFGLATKASCSNSIMVDHWLEATRVLMYDEEAPKPTEELMNLPPVQDTVEARGESHKE